MTRFGIARDIPSDAPYLSVGDAQTKEFALRALEAARAAGAQYADVRLTYNRKRDCIYLSEEEELGIGVRSLVNGYWGFACGPTWSLDGAARVGREATLQARVNNLGKPRVVDLGAIPIVRGGDWTTPVGIDPFEVPIEEIRDWVKGLLAYANALLTRQDPDAYAETGVAIVKRQQAFASSEGSYFTQTLYTMNTGFGISYKQLGRSVPSLNSEAKGWEYFYDSPIRDWVPRAMAEIEKELELPVKPLDVGRYQVVFDADSMSSLLVNTLGAAAQIDRALGYEANASGTSYLGPDPFESLGGLVASPAVTVTAERSSPASLATVKWDDEGVEPEPFTLVRDGVLVDYQTTREQAAWLAPWYQKRGAPTRSHGCAHAPGAFDVTMQHTPNLALAPGRENTDIGALTASVSKGILVSVGTVNMDQQCLNGLGFLGGMYEIVNGRRTARLAGAGSSNAFLFRSPQLWKNIVALGGSASVVRSPRVAPAKGEPAQAAMCTVSAVPALVKDVVLIDASKRA